MRRGVGSASANDEDVGPSDPFNPDDSSIGKTEARVRPALEVSASQLGLRDGVEEVFDAGRDAGGEVDVHEPSGSVDDCTVVDPVLNDGVDRVACVGDCRRAVSGVV